MTSQSQNNSSISDFLLGLIFGMLGGGLLAYMLSPRSGEENIRLLKGFPKQIREDWDNPYGKSHSFLQNQQARLETTVSAFQDSRKARRWAKAKRREEEQAPSEIG